MNVQPTNERIDAIFERYLQPGSPGCAVALIDDEQIAYQQGYGLANLEHVLPILPSTTFNIGSMAKQFTAFAIALLEVEGKLRLDDSIRTHLPEMHDFGPAVTLRHLIHHTSGLRCTFPELLALAGWRDSDLTTTDDAFRLLRAQRELNFRPGSEFLYANSGYILLALVVERASQTTFSGFCRERIFEPLGMASTHVNDSVVKIIPGRSSGYYENEQGGWLNAPLTDSVVGPTNIYTTVKDLALWDHNFYTGKVGGPKLIARLHERGYLNDGSKLDYAFGLNAGPNHTFHGWQVVEHGGGQGGYGSWMMRFPERRLSVIVLFNHFLWNMRDYAGQVAALFLEDRSTGSQQNQESATPKGQPGAAPDANHLHSLTGSYYSSERAALRQVTLVEGTLQYQGLDLVPRDEFTFTFAVDADTCVEFALRNDGTVERLTTVTPSGPYSYHRADPVDAPSLNLAEYAGRYYSPELDVYWRLIAADGELVARRHKYVDSPLTPLFADAFSDDWLPIMEYPTTYLIVFERDQDGEITGLRVSGSRVRHLWFRKEETGYA